MWVKIHNSSRRVVAVCDESLLGKKFEQGIRQLQITESFFKGSTINKKDLIELMKYEFKSNSTFNIVGKDSIKAAVEAGIIEKDSFMKVKGIPFVIIVN